MKDWLKGLGKAALDAGKAKLDDSRDRLAEPPLSENEKALYDRFRALGPEFLAQSEREGFPPCPPKETMFNRREIRALLGDEHFAFALQAGEAAAAEAAAQQRALEAQQAAEAALRKQAEQQAQLTAINAFYNNELNPLEVRLAEVRPHIASEHFKELVNYIAQETELTGNGPVIQMKSGIGNLVAGVGQDMAAKAALSGKLEEAFQGASYKRTLRDFSPGERGVLRLADVLHILGQISARDRIAVRLVLITNEGKSAVQNLIDRFQKRGEKRAFVDGFKELVDLHFGSAESVTELVQTRVRAAVGAESPLPGPAKAILLQHLYSGTSWLRPERATALAPNGATKTALRLGQFVDAPGELLYDRNESLVTIAPPGAGKSQAHVLRNLLYLNAPAVVLDVKGEMFAGSAQWRAANVGPVFRFAPADPSGSLTFNPLDLISTDPDLAYEQTDRLAGLLTVPPEKDEYFDNRSINLIHVVLLHVALTKTGAERSMESVLNILSATDFGNPDHPDAEADAFIQAALSSPSMFISRFAKALTSMPSKQREGVFDGARGKLKVWESPTISRLTRATTFRPEFLRAQRATLYLCVNLGDIARYASVLRVLIGMCIAHFVSKEAEAGEEPVTFFLDELPQLKRMEVVEEAVVTVRGYGVRLWLFTQSVEKLEGAYANAASMIKACLARMYMNPDEDRAQWLSENLGMRRGLLDGEEHPLVESYDLTGAEYNDRIIAMLTGFENARLAKTSAWADPICQERSAPKNVAGE